MNRHGKIRSGCSAEFERLCALFTASALDLEECARLEKHLAACQQCRDVIGEYSCLTSDGIGKIAALQSRGREEAEAEQIWTDRKSEARAKTLVLQKLNALQHRAERRRVHNAGTTTARMAMLSSVSSGTLGQIAAVLLVGLIGGLTVGYRLGAKSHASPALPSASIASSPSPSNDALQGLLSQRGQLTAQLAAAYKDVAQLKDRAEHQERTLGQIKTLKASLEQRLQEIGADNRQKTDSLESVSAQRDALQRKLEDARQSLQAARIDLRKLRAERQRTLLRATSLETASPSSSAAIEGTVSGPEGGISGALIAVVPIDRQRAADIDEYSRASAVTTSGTDGVFHIEGLTAGSYAVSVTAPNLTVGFVGNLKVEAGHVLSNIQIKLTGGGKTLTGAVHSPEGKPLVNAEIRAGHYSKERGAIFYVRTNTRGEYSITVPEGRYFLLVFAAPDYVYARKEVEVNGDKTVDFTLDRDGPAPAEVVDWIRGHAISIATPEAGHGFADLQRLKKAIGSARLVELGEATHGTREFFQLKHRMLEFLVTEMDFNIFGIEATMPEAFDVNEYVLTGKGDPAKALAALYFWTWNTQEVLQMIEWMRQYNADPRHTKKVKFYGFDMQFAARAAKIVRAYLRRAGLEEASEFDAALQDLSDAALRFADVSQVKQEATVSAINNLIQRIDANKAAFIQRSSAEEWAVGRQCARILQQYMEYETAFAGPVRDKAMAENIRWILDQEGSGSKMVVWAHNGHVAATPGTHTMGSHLREALGREMVVFGFAFNRGSFQAIETPPTTGRGRHPFTINAAAPGSLDSTLAAARSPLAALDLRDLPPSGLVTDWFARPHATRSIGAIFEPERTKFYAFPRTITQDFDVLLFVENTSAAHAIVPGYPIPVLPMPSNLDFESGKIGAVPDSWLVRRESAQFDFHVGLTAENPYSGKQCVQISREPGKHYGESSGSVFQTIEASAFRGKRIRLQGWVRGRLSDQQSRAHLILNVQKQNILVGKSYDAMAQKPQVTNEWQPYEVIADVPDDAITISYSFSLVGDGSIWLDAVSVESVSAPEGH